MQEIINLSIMAGDDSADMAESDEIQLCTDGKIKGAAEGTWNLKKGL